jgi:hypothetical protein
MTDKQHYHKTIIDLFTLLEQANAADSDNNAKDWQVSYDCLLETDPTDCDYYYTHLHRAIKSIAGDAILQHWAEFGEIDLDLASRSVGDRWIHKL